MLRRCKAGTDWQGDGEEDKGGRPSERPGERRRAERRAPKSLANSRRRRGGGGPGATWWPPQVVWAGQRAREGGDEEGGGGRLAAAGSRRAQGSTVSSACGGGRRRREAENAAMALGGASTMRAPFQPDAQANGTPNPFPWNLAVRCRNEPAEEGRPEQSWRMPRCWAPAIRPPPECRTSQHRGRTSSRLGRDGARPPGVGALVSAGRSSGARSRHRTRCRHLREASPWATIKATMTET